MIEIFIVVLIASPIIWMPTLFALYNRRQTRQRLQRQRDIDMTMQLVHYWMGHDLIEADKQLMNYGALFLTYQDGKFVPVDVNKD